MAEKDRLIIGLTGSFASGCGTIGTHLEGKGFKQLSLTTKIKEVVVERSWSPNKENLQNIGDELRQKNGCDYFAKIVSGEIDESSDTKFIVKSFRNHHEVDYFRKKYISFILFSIDAERDIRYKRGEYSHPEIFDRDDERDSGEEQPEHGQHVRLCVDRSDIVINNNDNKESLFTKIDKYIDLIEHPRKFSPSLSETSMLHACAETTKNGCLKRAVGAIIVRQIGKGEGFVANGYNSTPGDLISCKDIAVCYRDISRKCPSCSAGIQIILEKCNNCGIKIEKQRLIELNKNLDLCRAIHAEERAILQGVKTGGGISLEGTILYTTTFPCILCAKKIIEVGIKRVWYIEPYPFRDAKDLLLKAGVELSKFEGVKSRAYDKLYMGQ